MIRPDRLQKEYDVIVVGSGAAGGQTAYTLTMDGAKVLMLEAGRNYVPECETPRFHTPDQAPLRGTSTPDKEFGFYDSTVEGGWQIPGEPYSNASEDKEQRFWWWRARMLGVQLRGRVDARQIDVGDDHVGHTAARQGPRECGAHDAAPCDQNEGALPHAARVALRARRPL
jgi:hypothetical protein